MLIWRLVRANESASRLRTGLCGVIADKIQSIKSHVKSAFVLKSFFV